MPEHGHMTPDPSWQQFGHNDPLVSDEQRAAVEGEEPEPDPEHESIVEHYDGSDQPAEGT